MVALKNQLAATMIEASLAAQLVKNLPTVQESACKAGDLGSIPGLGRSPGERNGNPLQYSCLENPMDRGAWPATVHGIARVGHYLATKPPPETVYFMKKKIMTTHIT